MSTKRYGQNESVPVSVGGTKIEADRIKSVEPQIIGCHYTLWGRPGRFTYSPICNALIAIGQSTD